MTTHKLHELAKTIRSKNAGVNKITFDIIFRDRENYERVKRSKALTRESSCGACTGSSRSASPISSNTTRVTRSSSRSTACGPAAVLAMATSSAHSSTHHCSIWKWRPERPAIDGPAGLSTLQALAFHGSVVDQPRAAGPGGRAGRRAPSRGPKPAFARSPPVAGRHRTGVAAPPCRRPACAGRSRCAGQVAAVRCARGEVIARRKAATVTTTRAGRRTCGHATAH